MAKIRLWKGYHDERLREHVAYAWSREELLVLCPPLLSDFGFVRFLPQGELELVGEWESELKEFALAKGAQPRLPAAFEGARPVFGVFTSGTASGSPRLVLYSRTNIESSLQGILSVFDSGQIRRIFCYPQAFHTFGLTLGYVLSILHDVPLVPGKGKYTRSFHESWVDQAGPGLLTLGAPAHFSDLIQFVAERGLKPRASYSSIVGGARTPVALWHGMRERLGIEAPSIGYGATEAAPGLTHLPPGHAPVEDGEIGFPLPHLASVRIEAGVGVRFSGPNLCLAVVSERGVEFPREMLIHDEVECRKDGVWLYRGRTDLVLNRGGVKFSLERIEELLKKRLGIEAVCVPLPDARLGEELGVLTRGSRSQDEVYQSLFESLGQRFERRYFAHVEEFPLNGSLKLDRKAAAALLRREAGLGE